MTFIKATCRKAVKVDRDQATPEQLEAAQKNRDGMPGHWLADRWVIPVQCAFETTNAAAYEQHMVMVHEIKQNRRDPQDSNRGQRSFWDSVAMPGLHAKKLYEPKPGEPGSKVTWRQLVETGETREERRFNAELRYDAFVDVPISEWAWRTGQVWSLGAYPKSLWVVPDEPLPGELAVCIRPGIDKSWRHDNSWRDEDTRRWKSVGGQPYGSAA